MMLTALLFAIVRAEDLADAPCQFTEFPGEVCEITKVKPVCPTEDPADCKDTDAIAFAYLKSSDAVTLTIDAMGNHTDHTNTYHSETKGDLTLTGSRYELSCAQPEGHKTLKVSVTRPSDMSHPAGFNLNYFQAEFVALYQKDSWIQEKTSPELEPYMHNDHGSIIPLSVLRTGADTWSAADLLSDDLSKLETKFEVLNVYMSVAKVGDYEFKYGNPNLRYSADPWNASTATKADCDGVKTVDGKGEPEDWDPKCGTWSSIGFTKTLRVGSPWKLGKQQCEGTGTDSLSGAVTKKEAGAILPLFMGHPNLDSDKYDAFIGQLNLAKTATAAEDVFTVYVVLDIFSPDAGSAEDPNNDGVLTVIADNAKKWTWSAANTSAYTTCYSSGNKCPENFRVCKSEHCHIDMWKSTITKLKANPDKIKVKVLGNIDTAKSTRSISDLKADVAAYQTHFGDYDASATDGIDGFFFSEIDPDADGTGYTINEYAAQVSKSFIKKDGQADTFTASTDYDVVFSTGEWLKSGTYDPETSKKSSPVLDDVDVVISVLGSDKGNWVPYAWYPDAEPTKWGAIVTEVPDSDIVSVAETMFDRGYGYVYLQKGDINSTFTDATDTYFETLAAEIVAHNKPTPVRRLQALDTGVATYKWGCDATEYVCKPICLMQSGVVTSTVDDKKCAGVAPDPCGCKCLFDAAWTCSGDDVVCQATNSHTLERRTVGDLVCVGRGSEKPSIGSFTKRVAGACENKGVAGYYPSQTCMAKAQTVKDEREAAIKAQEEAAAKAEAEAAAAAAAAATSTASPSVAAPVDAGVPAEDEMSIESFAAAATLAAVAALA